MAESRRQVAIAIDLNKCMGCQTCTVACKMLRTNDEGMNHMWLTKIQLKEVG